MAYGAFFLITHAAGGNQQFILQILILGYAAWRFVNLTVSARINTKAAVPPAGTAQPADEQLSLAYGLRLTLASRVSRLRLLFT